jgi:peptidyl-prolyl cis-trans isomerase SurA
MEVAQIVVTPKVSDAEAKKVIDKLNQFKKKLMRDQVSRQKQFCTLKILVQRSNGGFIK